jgi:polyphosphate glucokinase
MSKVAGKDAPPAKPTSAIPVQTPPRSKAPLEKMDPKSGVIDGLELSRQYGNALNGTSAHHAKQRSNALGAGLEIVDAKPAIPARPRVLVVDIGGTSVKLRAPDHELVKIPSGAAMTAHTMMLDIAQATKGWAFDVVSIGYPGVVKQGHVATEPKNLGKGWVGFDFTRAFGKPVKLVNDAGMQALGSTTKPGLTMFLGVGTGLGVALVTAEPRKDGSLDKRLISTELGHAHLTKHHDYESLVSKAALEGHDGKVSASELKSWTAALQRVVADLSKLLVPDHIVIGGGNVKLLEHFRTTFPDHSIVAGDNALANVGGEDLWASRPT